MSEQTSGTLPLAASITHLKLEAKALRAAFDGGDQAVRERVAVHLTPPPDALAHTQALFVVAREYGFPSWPVLKQRIQRRTRTVYSDVDGVAVAIAQLLGDASVTVAQTIEDALDSASEVLVLDLHRRLDHLEPERLAKLKYRKLVLLGPEADWLCRGLELEIGDGYVTREAVPLRIADSALLAGRLGESTRHAAIEPFARQPAIGSLFDRGKPHLHFSYVEDAMKLGATGGFVDVILARAEPGGERHAVVARQANFLIDRLAEMRACNGRHRDPPQALSRYRSACRESRQLQRDAGVRLCVAGCGRPNPPTGVPQSEAARGTGAGAGAGRNRLSSSLMRSLKPPTAISTATLIAFAKPSASVPPWLLTTMPFSPTNMAPL